MGKNSYFKESLILYAVRGFGAFIRCLPLSVALMVGKGIGRCAYYFNTKLRSQAYSNMKMAFARSKTPGEIRKINRQLFENYGQNLIELLRMPLLDLKNFDDVLTIDGKEHVEKALGGGKGCILLAMHFGSWELASFSCASLDVPYRVFVKPQTKYSRLDDLLNSYRTCGGSLVLERGMGTRELVKSLKNNQVVGMVVDQGGKDGTLVPFFDRQASMSVGAIRMGLKMGVPICFSIIIREKGAKHRMIIHEPMELRKTGNMDTDVEVNLMMVTQIMEHYIKLHPAEYMWFYKIWKYSTQAQITILSDGKPGHQRQSECVAKMVQKCYADRGIDSDISVVNVEFKNKWAKHIVNVLGFISFPFITQGRLSCLKPFLTEKCFNEIMSIKTDDVISCGSSVAGVNVLLTQECFAKNISVMRPGIMGFEKFELIFLPQHDLNNLGPDVSKIFLTHAAPNLINQDYLDEQSDLLLKRFSHLKRRARMTIGVFIGGSSKKVFITVRQIRILCNQLKELCNGLGAELLVTTSRRTSPKIEAILQKEFKKKPYCPLLILANKENVPEAVGGILGLSDLNIVSGDSISMVSEAATAGKNTIVFMPEVKIGFLKKVNKHVEIVEKLNEQGFVLSTDVRRIAQSVYSLAKGKRKTRTLNDGERVLEVVKEFI